MRIGIIVLCILASTAQNARAAPYWIAYEGNDLPENEGWTRSFGAGGANRWIDDGALVIDSRASTDIFDAYQHFGITDPEPGELFVAEWRLRVDELIRPPGPAFIADNRVIIARDSEPGNLKIEIATDEVQVRPGFHQISITPDQWHAYRLESADMQSYDLWIDGGLALSGSLESETTLQSFMAFGDTIIGAASLSRWDYVRFGVVPEPSAFRLFALLFPLALWRRRHGGVFS